MKSNFKKWKVFSKMETVYKVINKNEKYFQKWNKINKNEIVFQKWKD